MLMGVVIMGAVLSTFMLVVPHQRLESFLALFRWELIQLQHQNNQSAQTQAVSIPRGKRSSQLSSVLD